MNKFKVSDEQAGVRLDVFLASQLQDLSRSFIKKLLEDEKITVNQTVRTPSYKVKAGDKVAVLFDLNNANNIEEIDLPVLYEDDDCVVIDKPVGVLTHSKGNFNPEATVATWLEPRTRGIDGNRAGIVHRLDRATSGVMICAKTPEALSWLQKQFSTRKTKKTYVAIIEGELEPKAAVIDMPIERHPAKPKIFRVGENGRPSQTEYQTLETANGYSKLKLLPKTGRTHQLRVHLKQLGHPIVGDFFYEGKPADRLFLHALSLELTLPNRQRQTFEAKLPAEFDELMS